MCRFFPCIPIFRGGGLLKNVKKCVCVLVLKITLLLVENVCFGVKKGISEFWRQAAQKQSIIIHYPLFSRKNNTCSCALFKINYCDAGSIYVSLDTDEMHLLSI